MIRPSAHQTIDNMPFSEQYRVAAEDWADKESAANLLESLRGAALEQRIKALGDVPYNRAERDVKSSEWYEDYVKKMCGARAAATSAKIKLEYLRMRYFEFAGQEASRRAEIRIS